MTWRDTPKSLAHENFFAVPIFIQNFNRFTFLKKQIHWLLNAGYKNICIIDNQSNYPPLLAFYEELAAQPTFKVVRHLQNSSRLALWESGALEQFEVTGPFVYTDSDVIPDRSCPVDVVAHLAMHLHDNPGIFKAALGLRIDDLPETYKFRNEVIAWERQFWRAPVARGLFLANTDTTFALYRPGSGFSFESVRTGWPYLARHEPWYADSEHPTEEDKIYEATAHRGHWSRKELPNWLRAETAARSAVAHPKLLHLGCGHELIPGWINLDVSDRVGANLVFDLELCGHTRLPIDDNSIDGFFMCHVFEHIDNTLAMMQELYRIAKPKARFVIRVPHGASNGAFDDPTHKRPYFPSSFMYFAQPAYSRADYNYLADWQVTRVKLVVDSGLLNTETEARILERINSERNLVLEMIVELCAVKPQRAREMRQMESPLSTLSGTRVDIDSTF